MWGVLPREVDSNHRYLFQSVMPNPSIVSQFSKISILFVPRLRRVFINVGKGDLIFFPINQLLSYTRIYLINSPYAYGNRSRGRK
jgi:hypothetical protein